MSTQSPYRVASPLLKKPIRCPPSVTSDGKAQAFAAGVMGTTTGLTDVDLEVLCGRKWERFATAKWEGFRAGYIPDCVPVQEEK